MAKGLNYSDINDPNSKRKLASIQKTQTQENFTDKDANDIADFTGSKVDNQLTENVDWTWKGFNDVKPLFALTNKDDFVAITFADFNRFSGVIIQEATNDTGTIIIVGIWVKPNGDQEFGKVTLVPATGGSDYSRAFESDPKANKDLGNVNVGTANVGKSVVALADGSVSFFERANTFLSNVRVDTANAGKTLQVATDGTIEYVDVDSGGSTGDTIFNSDNDKIETLPGFIFKRQLALYSDDGETTEIVSLNNMGVNINGATENINLAITDYSASNIGAPLPANVLPPFLAITDPRKIITFDFNLGKIDFNTDINNTGATNTLFTNIDNGLVNDLGNTTFAKIPITIKYESNRFFLSGPNLISTVLEDANNEMVINFTYNNGKQGEIKLVKPIGKTEISLVQNQATNVGGEDDWGIISSLNEVIYNEDISLLSKANKDLSNVNVGAGNAGKSLQVKTDGGIEYVAGGSQQVKYTTGKGKEYSNEVFSALAEGKSAKFVTINQNTGAITSYEIVVVEIDLLIAITIRLSDVEVITKNISDEFLDDNNYISIR